MTAVDIERYVDGDASAVGYIAAYANLAHLAAGRRACTVTRSVDAWKGNDTDCLPPAEWGDRHLRETRPPVPTLYAAFMPRLALCQVLRTVVECAYSRRTGRVNVRTLTKYLGLAPREAAALARRVAACLRANPGRDIDLAPALAPFRARILRRYEAARAEPLEWWIRADPGRQYTASLNPRMEDPAEWCGAARVAPNPCSAFFDEQEPQLAAARAAAAAEAAEAEAEKGRAPPCGCCGAPLAAGEPNRIALACGHAFHWTQSWRSGQCGGYLLTTGLDRYSEGSRPNGVSFNPANHSACVACTEAARDGPAWPPILLERRAIGMDECVEDGFALGGAGQRPGAEQDEPVSDAFAKGEAEKAIEAAGFAPRGLRPLQNPAPARQICR